MLSDYERQMCRDYKKRLDAQQTPQGQAAMRLAKAKQAGREERERILEFYSRSEEPSVDPAPKPQNPILEAYMNK